jgi:hypothetical protein
VPRASFALSPNAGTLCTAFCRLRSAPVFKLPSRRRLPCPCAVLTQLPPPLDAAERAARASMARWGLCVLLAAHLLVSAAASGDDFFSQAKRSISHDKKVHRRVRVCVCACVCGACDMRTCVRMRVWISFSLSVLPSLPPSLPRPALHRKPDCTRDAQGAFLALLSLSLTRPGSEKIRKTSASTRIGLGSLGSKGPELGGQEVAEGKRQA